VRNKKKIHISGRQELSSIVISVQDSGSGIKTTDQPFLFDFHFTTKGSAGRGIGLSLCRQIVQSHDGTIEVKSEEGKGAEFEIRFPIIDR